MRPLACHEAGQMRCCGSVFNRDSRHLSRLKTAPTDAPIRAKTLTAQVVPSKMAHRGGQRHRVALCPLRVGGVDDLAGQGVGQLRTGQDGRVALPSQHHLRKEPGTSCVDPVRAIKFFHCCGPIPKVKIPSGKRGGIGETYAACLGVWVQAKPQGSAAQK